VLKNNDIRYANYLPDSSANNSNSNNNSNSMINDSDDDDDYEICLALGEQGEIALQERLEEEKNLEMQQLELEKQELERIRQVKAVRIQVGNRTSERLPKLQRRLDI
jgi:hypothetical protein